MDLTILGGAAAIALASAAIFLAVVRLWTVLTQKARTTRFPKSIMREAAQRFRDEHTRLGLEQSTYLVTGLVFTVVFCVSYLLPPESLFDNVPRWQLWVVLVLLLLGAGFVAYRLVRTMITRRRLLFIRDANMATGHSLQKLTSNRNRVFHDVPCGEDTIDNVIVGLHGVYAVTVVARRPGKNNQVQLKGNLLRFANSKKPDSVARSGQKSERLAKELSKLTGHDIRVRSVISVPGWEVDQQASSEFLVVNERNVAMLTGWKEQKDYLMNEDVEAIHKLLTERCTLYAAA